jgi:hypothetical protein
MTTKAKSKADPKPQAKPKSGQRTKPKSRSGPAKSDRRGDHSKERKPKATRSAGSKRLAPGALADLVLAYMREHADALPLGPGPIAKGLDRSAGAVANSLERLADADGPVRRAGKKPRLYDLKGDEPSKPAAS